MLQKVLTALLFLSAANASKNELTVRGSFYCDRNVKLPIFVELMDENTLEDDRLAWVQLRPFKMFELEGKSKKFFGFAPYLRVMHACRGFKEELFIPLRSDENDIDIGDLDLGDPKTRKEVLRYLKM